MTHNRTDFTALYPVIAVESPAVTADAFKRLLALETVFDSGWYIHLKNEAARLQLGFVRFDHDSVPAAEQKALRRYFVTVETTDATAVWEGVKGEFDAVLPLTDEDWGQRHFILRLPGNVLADVVQMLPATANN